MRRKDKTVFVARLLVTLLLVAFVGWRLEFGVFFSRLTALALPWTCAAFGVVFLAIAVSAWKWKAILDRRGYVVSYLKLLRLYLVGLFFNNVLPTTVGGDAVRAWETTRETGEIPEAVGSVVTERLIAGVALGFTALLGLPFIEFGGGLWWTVAAFLAVDVGLVALFLVPKVAEGVVRKLLPRRFSAAGAAVTQTIATVRATLREPRLFVRVFMLSVLFQVGVATVNLAIFRAMGVDIGLAECVIFTPMIFTVTMLPVSISGFGLREAAYWYFFSQAGVSQVDAVACSLLFFVIVGICSLPGAPLFVLGRERRPASVTPQPSHLEVRS